MQKRLTPDFPILIVDDEPNVVESQTKVLNAEGLTNLKPCREAGEALAVVRVERVDLVLLDLALPGMTGEELLAELRHRIPDVPVIVVTSAADVETAVRCMKAGAFDYMVKPVERSRFVSGVKRALEVQALKREYAQLRDSFLQVELIHPEAFSGIITQDPKMLALFRFIEALARTTEPVLILGETGVGKELLARAVHAASGRSGNLVVVNVAGFDDAMLSDALFGHRKGAYTGAEEPRKGLLANAEGGSVFLDEIGDASPASQVKLLRLLESGEYLSLGSDVVRKTDARFILATNRNLSDLIAKGQFRSDLYYRFSTHQFQVPPLRERPADIPLLFEHFLKEACETFRRPIPRVPSQTGRLLQGYDFPGNVRELRSLVFDAVGRLTGHTLPLEPFLSALSRGRPGSFTLPAEPAAAGLAPANPAESHLTLKAIVDRHISEALARANGNLSAAAKSLGVSRQALSKRLRRRPEGAP